MTVTCIREGVQAKYRSSTTLLLEHSGKAYEGSYYTVVNADSDITIVIVLKLILVVKIIVPFVSTCFNCHWQYVMLPYTVHDYAEIGAAYKEHANKGSF